MYAQGAVPVQQVMPAHTSYSYLANASTAMTSPMTSLGGSAGSSGVNSLTAHSNFQSPLHYSPLLPLSQSVPALPVHSPPPPDATVLYVAGLPRQWSITQVNALMQRFGHIQESKLLLDAQQLSRGVAFVRMASEQQAADAIAALAGQTLPSEDTGAALYGRTPPLPRPLIVKVAHDKTHTRPENRKTAGRHHPVEPLPHHAPVQHWRAPDAYNMTHSYASQQPHQYDPTFLPRQVASSGAVTSHDHLQQHADAQHQLLQSASHLQLNNSAHLAPNLNAPAQAAAQGEQHQPTREHSAHTAAATAGQEQQQHYDLQSQQQLLSYPHSQPLQYTPAYRPPMLQQHSDADTQSQSSEQTDASSAYAVSSYASQTGSGGQGSGASRDLFVFHLPALLTDAELLSLFSLYGGTVTSACVIRDAMSGASKGFGFVSMATVEEAAVCIHHLNGARVGQGQAGPAKFLSVSVTGFTAVHCFRAVTRVCAVSFDRPAAMQASYA